MRLLLKILLVLIFVGSIFEMYMYSELKGYMNKNPDNYKKEETSYEDDDYNKFPEIQIIGKEKFEHNISNISADIYLKYDEPEIIYRYDQGRLHEAIVNTILVNKGSSGYANITLKVNGVEGKPKQTYFEKDEEKTMSFSVHYKDRYPILYYNIIVINKDPYIWIKLDNNKTFFVPVIFSGLNPGPISR